MIVFFSGGGSPWIPELFLKKPAVMLSPYTNAKNWKPDARLRRAIKARKKTKK